MHLHWLLLLVHHCRCSTVQAPGYDWWAMRSHSLSSHCWSPSWWPWWNHCVRECIHRTPPASCLRSPPARVADEALQRHTVSWVTDATINIKQADVAWKWNRVTASCVVLGCAALWPEVFPKAAARVQWVQATLLAVNYSVKVNSDHFYCHSDKQFNDKWLNLQFLWNDLFPSCSKFKYYFMHNFSTVKQGHEYALIIHVVSH